MNMKLQLIAGALCLSIAGLSACGGSETNVNVRSANTNANTNVNRVTPVPSPTMDRTNANISRDEYDKNRTEYEKDRGTSTIGQGANDSWLWFKTRAALAVADDLRDSTINVDVTYDVVTLKGTVANAAQKAAAEKTAKEVEGVKSVKNELTVRPNDSATNQMVNGNSANRTGSANNSNR